MIAEDLTKMLETSSMIIDNQNINEDTARQADDCIQSLLKSMAKHGFNITQPNTNT